MHITLVQDDFTVGDLAGNAHKIIAYIKAAAAQQADLIVFPELSLSGYPPYDFFFRPTFHQELHKYLALVSAATSQLPLYVVLGYPHWHQDQQTNQIHLYLQNHKAQITNRLIVLHQDAIVTHYDKQALPNYQIFDEQRYFKPGHLNASFICADQKFQLAICEDIWEAADKLAEMQADWLLVANASPYHLGKPQWREEYLAALAAKQHKGLIYVNIAGGQDEMLFDGGSRIFNSQGKCLVTLPQFQASAKSYDTVTQTLSCLPITEPRKGYLLLQNYGYELHQAHDTMSEIYHALVAGLQDFVRKTGFHKAVLGLSGGIDSALTLAIAVEALGKDAVTAVMLPYKFTADISLIDAQIMANRLQVKLLQIPIHQPVAASETAIINQLDALSAEDSHTKEPVQKTLSQNVLQNIQARTRAILLMALANKLNTLLLTTGNKSELAVGYTTLYGDMCGAFNPIKDLYKTTVYQLAHWLNKQQPIIPDRIISRAPSAELAVGQKDEDHLPPYDVLDFILKRYIEYGENAATIEAALASNEAKLWVKKVIHMISASEHKRHQAAPGIRISCHGFGKDWRYPVASSTKVFSVPF